jgi:hypothetical protein
MNATQRIGLRSELAFQTRCLDRGLEFAVPCGVERYDLVLRWHDVWERVQIKTAMLHPGYLEFNTNSNAAGVGRPVGYEGCADMFGIYSPHLDRCFLLPVADAPRGSARLRLAPTVNQQSIRVRWAEDFAF